MNTLYYEVLHGYRNRATVLLYWGVCSLTLIAAGVYLWWGDPTAAAETVFIFLLMLIPSLLKERYRLYLPFALELGIVVFIFLTLFLGGIARWYETIPFWAKFTHFQSGLILVPTGYILVYILNEHEKTHLNLSPGFIALFAVAFAMCIGALWDIFEFLADQAMGGDYWQPIGDGFWDLVADFVGSLIVSTIGYFWMYRHMRLPFTPWLLRILEKLEKSSTKTDLSAEIISASIKPDTQLPEP